MFHTSKWLQRSTISTSLIFGNLKAYPMGCCDELILMLQSVQVCVIEKGQFLFMRVHTERNCPPQHVKGTTCLPHLNMSYPLGRGFANNQLLN
jgi:hypothetical protein